MSQSHFFHNGTEFEVFIKVNDVFFIISGHGSVGGNHHHFQAVDFGKFFGFRIRRTGHSGDFVVHAEVVLEGNSCHGFVVLSDPDMLLGFNRLMQTFGIPAAMEDTAGELIHDFHLVILDHIVHIFVEQLVGPQGLSDIVEVLKVFLFEEARGDEFSFLQEFFYFIHTLVREGNSFPLLVQFIIPHGIFFRIIVGGGIFCTFC